MSTTTLPAPTEPAVDDPLVHVWCCGDYTLCGLTVVGGTELPGAPPEGVCPLCRLADEDPCPRCSR